MPHTLLVRTMEFSKIIFFAKRTRVIVFLRDLRLPYCYAAGDKIKLIPYIKYLLFGTEFYIIQMV